MSKKKKTRPAPVHRPAAPRNAPGESWYLRNWFWLSFGVLLAAVLATFGGAFGHDFVSWDDAAYVYKNPLILHPTAAGFNVFARQVVSLNYHPLTMWSLWLNALLFGAGAKSFIVTNVLLHWLNAGLVCWLVWLLTGRQYRSVALLTALLFALHPLRVESVVWISERKDVLYVFFFLAGCITYWQYLESQRKSKILLSLGLMLLACLSKGVAVVFPLVCLLLDYWKGRQWSAALLIEKLPMFALSLLFGLIALNVQSGGDFYGLLTIPDERLHALSTVFSPGQKLLFGGYGYAMYFAKTFAPFDLCTFYPYPPQTEARAVGWGVIFMLLTLGAAAWSARYTRLFAFGFGWVLATVLLVLQFVSVGVVIMADRYFYLPSVGVFFMLTYGIEVFFLKNKPAGWRKTWWAIGVAFALWCLWLSREQSKTWQNSETLWQQVLRYYPTEDQALESLANWYGEQNRIPEAEQMLEKALQDGCERPKVYSALANCIAIKAKEAKDSSAQRTLYERAFSLYARSIALDSKSADTYFNRAFTALTLYPERSLADLDTAMQIAPQKALQYKQMRGAALANLKRYPEAALALTEVIETMEKSPQTLKIQQERQRLSDAYLDRGMAVFNGGNRAAGIADVQKSLSIEPQNQRAAGVLARIREMGGQ